MGGSGYWRTSGGDEETGAKPASSQPGQRDEPPGDADQPKETGSTGAGGGNRVWLNIDNESDEKILSFFGDRTDRLPTDLEAVTPPGRRSADQNTEQGESQDRGNERDQRPTAPELPEPLLRHYRDHVLPTVGVPREQGKPTAAAVFDADGFRGQDWSGSRIENGELDPRVATAKDWMREFGWRQGPRIETHVESKVVVDMVEGRLPNHVTLVINNDICKDPPPEQGRADIVSCRRFITESLYPDQSLRVYNHNGTMELFRGRDA